MTDTALLIPRRLAIEILHATQIAQPAAIRGSVTARNGVPARYCADGAGVPDGETLWARLWSHPQGPAVPTVEELADGGLSLLVSLNTKGVLEMRAWRLVAGKAQEQTLTIIDSCRTSPR